jgi:hypothetical protein
MWKRVKGRGKIPGALSKHSAITHNGKIFIYGGTKAGGDVNDSLYVYDSHVNKWDCRPCLVSIIFN